MKTTFIRILLILVLLSFLFPASLPFLPPGWRDETMARGAPDHSNVRAYGPVQRLDDMSELAARLGSADIFERGGRVVYIESFKYGLGTWESSKYGTGADLYLDPSQFQSGPFSLRMIGGSDDIRAVKVFRKFAYPVLSKYAVEFAIKFEQYTEGVTCRLVRHDGTLEHQYAIHYDVVDEILRYKDSDGNFQDIETDLDLTAAYMGFHVFKLIVDFDNDVYDALIVDNVRYDLSDLEGYTFATDDCPNVRIDLIIYSESGHNGYSFIDDVILTQAEP